MLKQKINKKTFNEIFIVISIVLTLFLFRDWIITLLEKLYPLTSSIPNKNYFAQFGLCLLVIISYVVFWEDCIVSSHDRLSIRTVSVILGFFIFKYYVSSGRIELFYCINASYSYIDVCFVIAVINEIIIYLCANCCDSSTVTINQQTSSLLYDTPSDTDSLKRTIHANVLVNKVAKTLSGKSIRSSFCILLNEQYGAGKTSFFKLLGQKSKEINLSYVEFRPWLSSSTSAMISDLVMLLEKELRVVNRNLGDSLKSYAKIVSEIHINTIGLVFNDNLQFQSITDRRQELVDKMEELKKPILVLVDDVDRLDSEELLSLFKLIRNTADFPYLCYVIAADKESLSQNLKNQGIVDTDLYMRKFFNLELSFPPEDNELKNIIINSIKDLLRPYESNEKVLQDYCNRILEIEGMEDVFTNPRDIFRFTNLVSYTMDIINEYNIVGEVNKYDVLLLSLVQFINPSWYKVLRDRNDKLLNYNGIKGRFTIDDSKLISFEKSSFISTIDQKFEPESDQIPDNNDNQFKRNPLKAMRGILYNLFGPLNNYRTPESICFKNEYFKYFAGHYRDCEMTTAEAFSYIQLTENEFKRFIETLSSKEKVESFEHKVSLYIQEGNVDNRLEVLKKILILADKNYSYSKDKTAYDLFPNSTAEQNINELFMYVGDTVRPLNMEIALEKERFVAFIMNDSRFDLLSLVLSSFKVGEDMHLIYGDHLVVQLKGLLIKRFIREKMQQNPFDLNVLKNIPYLREMYSVNWNQSLSKFINSYSNPMEWLYRLVSVNNNGKINWNRKYAYYLCGSVDGISSFITSMKMKIAIGNLRDIIQLTAYNSLSKITVDDHPFLRDALKWHLENQNKKQ